MPRASGIYSLPSGNPVITGTVISSTVQNNTQNDIATALTQSIAVDGQTVPTANLPMAGFKLTNLAAGTLLTDSANLGQIQNQVYALLTGVAGTNTITASSSPAIAAYVTGQEFKFVSAGSNSSAATININGLGAKALTKNGAVALSANDIPSGAIVDIVYDGTQFQVIGVSTLAGNVSTFINFARGSVVMDATLMNLWALPNTIDGTGSSPVITAIVNAPQAGATRTLYPPFGTTITNGATFAVDGFANYSTTTNDALIFEAITTSTYKVHIISGNGIGVQTVNTVGTQTIAGLKTFTTQPNFPAQSMIRLNTSNGYGSTNTRVRRWTTTVTTQGSDISYTDSATNGGSFTINTNGTYAVSYTDSFGAASSLGIVLNGVAGTTNVDTINNSTILSLDATGGASFSGFCSWTGYLPAASIIWSQTNASSAGTPIATITITRLS